MSATHGVIYRRLIGRARLRHLELLVAVVDQGAVKRAVVRGPASVAAWYVQLGLAVRLKLDATFPIPGLGVVYPTGAANEPVTVALLDALRSATDRACLANGLT
jgi:DNA-binding transcriptional LysR family regulator